MFFMAVGRRILIGEAVLASAVLFILSASAWPLDSIQSTSSRPFEDINIREHKGRFESVNQKGGFRIENIYGSADLKATGSVKVQRVDGDLRVTTQIGDIDVGEVKGRIIASTGSGNIRIEKAHKHVSLGTEFGEIIVESAASVKIKNGLGGDVKLLDIQESADVVTRGNIHLALNGKAFRSDLCSLASKEGDITLYLPEHTGADIEIRVPLSEDPKREAHFESDFAFTKFDQKCLANRILILTVQINGGGGKILLQIEKGNVYLRATKAGKKP